MLVILAVLFVDVPQEHQLCLQAVFVTENSDPVHHSRQYRLFIGCVMMGLGVEIDIDVCV
jgi:hypothetical protein